MKPIRAFSLSEVIIVAVLVAAATAFVAVNAYGNEAANYTIKVTAGGSILGNGSFYTGGTVNGTVTLEADGTGAIYPAVYLAAMAALWLAASIGAGAVLIVAVRAWHERRYRNEMRLGELEI